LLLLSKSLRRIGCRRRDCQCERSETEIRLAGKTGLGDLPGIVSTILPDEESLSDE